MLKIDRKVIEALKAHARKELPYEACGYLAGVDKEINAHYELTNIDRSAEHFSMKPEEQFSAVKDMRSKGVELRAVYHSHPETPARPSEEDIRLAYDPNISFVIISLAGAEADIKSFLINKGVVVEEAIEIQE